MNLCAKWDPQTRLTKQNPEHANAALFSELEKLTAENWLRSG